MSKLTKKQFDKVVGKLDREEDQEWLAKHPVEMTDKWIYKWEVYNAHKVVMGHDISYGCPHADFSDYESEGFYGWARYQEDHDEDS